MTLDFVDSTLPSPLDHQLGTLRCLAFLRALTRRICRTSSPPTGSYGQLNFSGANNVLRIPTVGLSSNLLAAWHRVSEDRRIYWFLTLLRRAHSEHDFVEAHNLNTM